MISNYDLSKLPDLICHQLESFFPLSIKEKILLHSSFPIVIEREEKCLERVDNKYFHRNGHTFFSPFHSGEWLIMLYYWGNTLSTKLSLTDECNKENVNKILADKIYYLNKILHAVDIYHEVELPDSFFLEHPVGTVLGRAIYKDGFMAYQNCTVGGNKGYYPSLGENFKMMSGSKILGKSVVGNNVTLAANAYVKDTDIPDNATVFGTSPNLIIKYLK